MRSSYLFLRLSSEEVELCVILSFTATLLVSSLTLTGSMASFATSFLSSLVSRWASSAIPKASSLSLLALWQSITRRSFSFPMY